MKWLLCRADPLPASGRGGDSRCITNQINTIKGTIAIQQPNKLYWYIYNGFSRNSRESTKLNIELGKQSYDIAR